MKKIVMLCCSLLLLLPPALAVAGRALCGNQEVPRTTRRCPDGGLPVFVADEIKPYTSTGVKPYSSDQVKPYQSQPVQNGSAGRHDDRQPASKTAPGDAGSAELNSYFGVWRTRIPGAVWTSPSGYQGYDWLHVSAGVSVGDLIIRPDGTYIWNSYGGKKGKWVRGDESYPIVLIDATENRKWKVAVDPRHTGGRDIVIWDGNYYYYDGRR